MKSEFSVEIKNGLNGAAVVHDASAGWLRAPKKAEFGCVAKRVVSEEELMVGSDAAMLSPMMGGGTPEDWLVKIGVGVDVAIPVCCMASSIGTGSGSAMAVSDVFAGSSSSIGPSFAGFP